MGLKGKGTAAHFFPPMHPLQLILGLAIATRCIHATNTNNNNNNNIDGRVDAAKRALADGSVVSASAQEHLSDMKDIHGAWSEYATNQEFSDASVQSVHADKERMMNNHHAACTPHRFNC